MSGIQAVNSYDTKPLLRTSNTGYAALAGVGMTSVFALSKDKSIRKCHKYFGIYTILMAVLHLGVILHSRAEWKKQLAAVGQGNINTQKNEGAV